MAVALLLVASGARTAAGQRPATELDTVRVTVSSRTPSAAAATSRSADVINRSEIERRPGRSVAELLATALGVEISARSPAQADLAMRGSSFSQVLVLVDGVRVGDLQSNHFNLDIAVPLDAVERIEILRGPGSAMYGPDAAGGVVNIVTTAGDDGQPDRQSLRGWGGSFGTAGAALFGRRAAGGLRVEVGAEHERSDGHRPGTDFTMTQATIAANRAALGGRLRARGGLGRRAFGAADFYGSFPSYERTMTTTASLRYEAGAHGRVQRTITGSFRRHSDDFILDRSNPDGYRNRHLTWQSGLEATARIAPGRGLSLAIGAEGLDGRLWSERLGDRHERRGALFAEATHLRPRGLVLNAGTRIDWSSVNGSFASPSVGAAIPLGRAGRLRTSVGRGFRAPTWTERFYEDPANVGDPNLQPEEFWAAEVGLFMVPADRWTADVAVFVRQATNLIDWARPEGSAPETVWRTMNIASATYRGLEFDLGLPDVLRSQWSIRGSALTFNAEDAAGFVGKYALQPTTRTAGILMTTPFGGGGSISLDAAHGRRAESDYTQVNARVAYPWRGVRFVLDARNLTDAEYLDPSAKPVAGRAAYITLEWGRE